MNDLQRRCGMILVVMAMLVNACMGPASTGTNPIPAAGATMTPLPGSPMSWIQVYFTNPGEPGAKYYEGGPDEALAAAIDEAILSVDVAIYNLNLWSIRDALINAQRRGVTVRVVMESDNMDAAEVQELLTAGIPIQTDQRFGLMHNKFVVIDRFEVWTGSMNYTVGGAYRDNNTLVRIRSVQAAENYSTEFEEMFIEDHFGGDILENTPHPEIRMDGSRVEVLFSPDDGVEERIVALIEAANESVHFMAYSFTSDEISTAILSATDREVMISGVMDEGQAGSNEGGEYENFRQYGLNVRLDGNDGLMHHKVIIIDEKIVILGSYNFTNSAETRNDENVMIIFNADVASQFMAEFQRVYALAKP